MGKTLVAGVLALLIGAAGGYWLGRREAPIVASQVAARPTQVEKQEIVARPVNATANTSPVRDGRVVQGDTLGLLRLLEKLQSKGMLNFNVQVFVGDKLSPAARELLRITDAEAAILDGTTTQARQRIAEIEASVAVTKPDLEKGHLVITVPPFPEQGGKVYDGVMNQFRDTLGPERNEILQHLGANQIEANFGGFGVAERTISLEHKTNEAGHEVFTMQDQRKATTAMINGGTSEGWSSQSSSQFLGRDQLVNQLGLLGKQFVPPNF